MFLLSEFTDVAHKDRCIILDPVARIMLAILFNNTTKKQSNSAALRTQTQDRFPYNSASPVHDPFKLKSNIPYKSKVMIKKKRL